MPIAGGQRHSLTVNLKSTEKPAAPAPIVIVPPPSSLATSDAPAPTPVTPATTIVEEHPAGSSASGSGSAVRTAAWIVGGGAVVALGAGVALQLRAHARSDEFNNSPCNDMDTDVPLSTECQSVLTAWESDRHWSIVGYVAGGALAITSGILFWSSRPSADATARAHFQCAPGPTGIGCQGVF